MRQNPHRTDNPEAIAVTFFDKSLKTNIGTNAAPRAVHAKTTRENIVAGAYNEISIASIVTQTI